MKKLLVLFITAAVIARAKRENEKASARSFPDRADKKREVLEKIESILENAYYAFAVCALKCRDLVSAIFS